ncbi:GntR family transcriptional regulator [Streptomyces odontomachi]|uniref:GntR family transcriptional regulator n=1 Tax=Streptomyces odontomachi TaxID=2944940 RepID=UPI00210988A4|nr:GntR family transcriptional regulator [Streptomyces sp. ODS25]
MDNPPASRRIDPPSLVELAAEQLRGMILAGELRPGDRLIEERLTAELGISRPPLREAMRLLQQEGLITMAPRRGMTVMELAARDVHEILTLRSALERLAVELGVPVHEPARLENCRTALDRMRECADKGDRAELVRCGYLFHRAIIELADHKRLITMYESLHRQLVLCMALNLYEREHYHEDLAVHVARHGELFDLIASGDRDAVLHALATHGERSFTDHWPPSDTLVHPD